MTGGGLYPGDDWGADPDYLDPDHLPHWQSRPMDTPRTEPEPKPLGYTSGGIIAHHPTGGINAAGAYGGNMHQEHTPDEPPLKHTAASERALHAFDQIAGPMFAKHGLGMVLEDIRTQLHRMRPYGDWQDNEREALEQARLSVVNAIDLLTRLEHP